MADVRLDDLSRVYPDGTRAVAGLTLYVRDRELLAVVGPSGCGKSTALRMVAGIEPIDGGTVTIGGRVVNGLKPHERDVAMVFERGALYPHLTAAQNLRFGLTARHLPETEIEQRVAAEARVLRLQRLLDRLPRTLSAGQQQRVALGRATVRVPKVFLLDEPLTHMDAGERTRLRSELAQLQHGLGVTTIYVTHDQAQAMAVGERVAVMRAGRIEQVADPRTLYHQPANAFVASFLGSPAMALVAGGLEADAGRTWVRLGSQRLGFPGTPSGRLRGRVGRPVTVGVRPEHLHEAAEARPDAAVLRATVARVERLGHETLAACAIDAQPVLVADTPGVADQPGDERALLTARLSGHHRARPGDPVDLSVDTASLSFFDPVSGDALWHPG